MPAPEVLAHHPFTCSEEVEGGSQPCGRDLLLGHPVKRITPAGLRRCQGSARQWARPEEVEEAGRLTAGSGSARVRPGTFSYGGGRFPAGPVNQEMNV